MSDITPRTVRIATAGLSATISTRGAELVRLQDGGGRDLLWDGDPAFWTGRAPLLFPIVGRLADDRLEVDGVTYPMKQHGIARTRLFTVVEEASDAVRFRLRDDDETRAQYPFAFTLDAVYHLHGPSLTVALEVANTGTELLPASAGFHPAFSWPLPYGAPREAHRVTFAEKETGALRRVSGGLLTPEHHPNPVQGRVLPLADSLFVDDALVFLDPVSRSVRYGAPDHPGLRVDFPHMPQLGLWTKPGAGFLCIEPWSGYASPQDFTGPFAAKPGLTHVPPGATHSFAFTVTLEPPAP